MSIDFIKSYLHIDDVEDDQLLNMMMESAKSYISTITKVRPEGLEHIPDELTQAMLYLISLWYEQRIPMGQSTKEIDHTISMLINPHNMGGMG